MDEIMRGKPRLLVESLIKDLSEEILGINENTYKDFCPDIKKISDVIYLLMENIDSDYVEVYYNDKEEFYLVNDRKDDK